MIDKQKEYYKKRIRPEQKKYLLRPVIYSILLAVPEGLTLEDITWILNNTKGTRQYKLSFYQVMDYIKEWKGSRSQTVFLLDGNKYRIRKIAKKTNIEWNRRPKETKQNLGGLEVAY